MSNILMITYEQAEGQLRDIYDMLIQKRGKLADVHLIQSLNPASIVAHMDLYITLMFGQSPLSREKRELLAVVVSVVNGCAYCQKHHSVALNNYWKNPRKIELLLQDSSLADLSTEEMALCHFAKELTRDPVNAGRTSCIDPLRDFGFDDRMILDATLVIAYFNFVNRIVLALGVQPESDAGNGFNY